jgi:hypothetical protein
MPIPAFDLYEIMQISQTAVIFLILKLSSHQNTPKIDIQLALAVKVRTKKYKICNFFSSAKAICANLKYWTIESLLACII